MILFCNQLYRSLQKDLAFYPEALKMNLHGAEAYFQCAFRHWMVLHKKMAAYTFRTLEEEIRFFRQVKPLFTCELEWARLLCQALLFQPQDEGQVEFWQRENKRLQKFVDEQASFYLYYRSGHRYKDAHCYTCLAADNRAAAGSLYTDERLRSRYDPLVARLLSLERFDRYVQLQLDVLNKAADG